MYIGLNGLFVVVSRAIVLYRAVISSIRNTVIRFILLYLFLGLIAHLQDLLACAGGAV